MCRPTYTQYHSPFILELIPELETLDLDLALALVFQDARIRVAVDRRLRNLIQVVLIALLPAKALRRTSTNMERGRVPLDEAVRSTVMSADGRKHNEHHALAESAVAAALSTPLHANMP